MLLSHNKVSTILNSFFQSIFLIYVTNFNSYFKNWNFLQIIYTYTALPQATKAAHKNATIIIIILLVIAC